MYIKIMYIISYTDCKRYVEKFDAHLKQVIMRHYWNYVTQQGYQHSLSGCENLPLIKAHGRTTEKMEKTFLF